MKENEREVYDGNSCCEQWIEEIDGVRHMVKAVKGVEGEKLCTACIFKPRIYPDYSKIRHDTVQTLFMCAYGVLCPIEEGYIIDLGPVNEDGVLAEERTGRFPTLKEKTVNGNNLFGYYVVAHHITVIVEWFSTKQEAIDAWNRRT